VSLDLRLAETALLDSCLIEGAHNGASRDAECSGDGQHGFALVVTSDDLGLVVRGESHTHDMAMAHATVNSVARAPFNGLVYNLGVEEDHSYVAGGIVVHNCHCALTYVPDGWTFDDDWVLRPPPTAPVIPQQISEGGG
jgi:hypothetical protein